MSVELYLLLAGLALLMLLQLGNLVWMERLRRYILALEGRLSAIGHRVGDLEEPGRIAWLERLAELREARHVG